MPRSRHLWYIERTADSALMAMFSVRQEAIMWAATRGMSSPEYMLWRVEDGYRASPAIEPEWSYLCGGYEENDG